MTKHLLVEEMSKLEMRSSEMLLESCLEMTRIVKVSIYVCECTYDVFHTLNKSLLAGESSSKDELS